MPPNEAPCARQQEQARQHTEAAALCNPEPAKEACSGDGRGGRAGWMWKGHRVRREGMFETGAAQMLGRQRGRERHLLALLLHIDAGRAAGSTCAATAQTTGAAEGRAPQATAAAEAGS